MYTAPPTFASPWNFSDANTFIRDNFNNLRNYQTNPHAFIDYVNSLGTGTATVASHLNLCATTPDEGTNLLVAVFIECNFGSFIPATTATFTIKDQGGTSLTPILNTYNLQQEPHTALFGFTTVAANTNPGFTVTGHIGTGTTAFEIFTLALVSPQ